MNIGDKHFTVDNTLSPSDVNQLIASENEKGQLILPAWVTASKRPNVRFYVWFNPNEEDREGKRFQYVQQQCFAFFGQEQEHLFFPSLATAYACLNEGHYNCSAWTVLVRQGDSYTQKPYIFYNQKKGGPGFVNRKPPKPDTNYTKLDIRLRPSYGRRHMTQSIAAPLAQPTAHADNEVMPLQDDVPVVPKVSQMSNQNHLDAMVAESTVIVPALSLPPKSEVKDQPTLQPESKQLLTVQLEKSDWRESMSPMSSEQSEEQSEASDAELESRSADSSSSSSLDSSSNDEKESLHSEEQSTPAVPSTEAAEAPSTLEAAQTVPSADDAKIHTSAEKPISPSAFEETKHAPSPPAVPLPAIPPVLVAESTSPHTPQKPKHTNGESLELFDFDFQPLTEAQFLQTEMPTTPGRELFSGDMMSNQIIEIPAEMPSPPKPKRGRKPKPKDGSAKPAKAKSRKIRSQSPKKKPSQAK